MSTIVPIGQSELRPAQAGRIRTGQKSATRKNRKGIPLPEVLSTFKFTTPHRDFLAPLAETYGGTVQPWNEPATGDRWQLVTEATVIDVVLPPEPLTQCYEKWQGGLERRCDGGATEKGCRLRVGTPDDVDFEQVECICRRKGMAECSYKLRLNVLIEETGTMLTWRWDSSSENVRKEVPGMVDTIQTIQARGFYKVKLRLEQRRQGRHHFTLPVLDPGVSLGALVAGDTRLVSLPVTPHTPAGELVAGGPEDDDALPASDSSGPPPTLPGSDAHTPSSVRALDDDDEIVDAEIIDDDLSIDALHMWWEALKSTEKNRWLRRAAEIANGSGQPRPMNAAAIPDEILRQLHQESGA